MALRLHFAPGSAPTSWKDICLIGRRLDDACKLSFIQPTKTTDGDYTAKIGKAEVESNAHKWENTLIGYVLGDKPSYSHVKACVTRLWKPNCPLDISSRDNGYFFLQIWLQREM